MRPVVVGGALGGVVAQVGGDAVRHRRRAHGAVLPFQEEGPGVVAPPQHPEGVGGEWSAAFHRGGSSARPAGAGPVGRPAWSGNGPGGPGAAMKSWTAPVCSMLRSNWRLRLPGTARHSGPASPATGETLHRAFAAPVAARSRRARYAALYRTTPVGAGPGRRRSPSTPGLPAGGSPGTAGSVSRPAASPGGREPARVNLRAGPGPASPWA